MKFTTVLSLLLSLFVSFADAIKRPSHYKEAKCSIQSKKRSSPSPLEHGSSLNWSGYVITPTTSVCSSTSLVTQVLGSWIVPAVAATPGIAHTYSSFWVGIDGWTDGQVEQLGTEHDSVNGVQQNYAWFEMYPAGSFLINGFPVDVGDLITAEVNYNGNNVFALSIVNDTKRVYYTVPASYTTVANAAPRTSAEWIAEAPYLNGILPLSNFGTAQFVNCTAQLNWAAILAIGQYADNVFINMVNPSGVLKDQVTGLFNNGENFNVTWKSSN